jgi:hypothetical protein
MCANTYHSMKPPGRETAVKHRVQRHNYFSFGAGVQGREFNFVALRQSNERSERK